VQAAFDIWQNADCGSGTHPSLTFMQLEDVPCDVGYTVAGGNANLVTFPSVGRTRSRVTRLL